MDNGSEAKWTSVFRAEPPTARPSLLAAAPSAVSAESLSARCPEKPVPTRASAFWTGPEPSCRSASTDCGTDYGTASRFESGLRHLPTMTEFEGLVTLLVCSLNACVHLASSTWVKPLLSGR
ncbi:hypothetical protein SKAU_G00311760 [Synaphobranchus kaupii]|uniref:Uncharacterized protein n=1 Tax=Synaphobranchus kaupii TaxID=118154 RepID=A0A9Q1ERX2_SYNKA|nr:hypothetical protein SKAU_G00311760 [Synaphobranchus kaupii]